MPEQSHSYNEGYGRPTLEELRALATLIQKQSRSNNSAAYIDRIDDKALCHKLDYHGVTLQALESGQLSKNIQNIIGPRKALMVANEALKARALVELFTELESEGLSNIVVFKGTALAYTVYQQPWLRPRSDSDCLINKDQLAAFTHCLGRQGFIREFSISGKHVSYQQSFHKKLAGQSTLNIDLHWKINNRQTLANTFTVEELRNSGVSLEKLAKNIKVPCNVDSVLIASLHRLGHHQNDERLAWLRDIDLLSRCLDEREWQQLCSKAKLKKLAAITLDALLTSKMLFDTPLPPSTEKTLKEYAQQKEPSHFFLNRGLSEWRYFWLDLKGLQGFSNKARLIIEHTLPNSEYVRKQMATDSLVLAHIKRVSRGIRRVFSK